MPERRYIVTGLWDVLAAEERSQSWLARKVGCHESLVSHIRAGRRSVPEWFVQRAAEALRLPISALFAVQVLPDESEALADERDRVDEKAA